MSKKTQVITGLIFSFSLIVSYFYWPSNSEPEVEKVDSLSSKQADALSAGSENELTAEKFKLFLTSVQKDQNAKQNALKLERTEQTEPPVQQQGVAISSQQPLVTTTNLVKLELQTSQKMQSLTKEQSLKVTQTVVVPEVDMIADSNELDSSKPEQLDEQQSEADPIAKYDALLAEVSLGEEQDSVWSQASQTAMTDLVETNPELQGLILLEKNCWSTLCRFEFAPSSADQAASFNEKLDRVTALIPWPAPSYLKVNLENESYPKATLYVAREGNSLPVLN